MESELFGHERGAFTGAVALKKGRFELADGGTIFLDEIGDISPSVQVKLLRVFQEREFERVGGTRTLKVDVRIITATNRELKAEVAAGRFREDLFYRVHGFPIHLPPLVERPEVIIPLAEYFLGQTVASTGRRTSLSAAAREALLRYPWPGNIRELKNVIERAAILAHGEIGASHLGLETGATIPAPESPLAAGEREVIRKALAQNRGNRKETARMLGISLRTLQYRVKEYGL
jgi:transcriptional regulator with GAF, ATPase, and Fis domain